MSVHEETGGVTPPGSPRRLFFCLCFGSEGGYQPTLFQGFHSDLLILSGVILRLAACPGAVFSGEDNALTMRLRGKGFIQPYVVVLDSRWYERSIAVLEGNYDKIVVVATPRAKMAVEKASVSSKCTLLTTDNDGGGEWVAFVEELLADTSGVKPPAAGECVRLGGHNVTLPNICILQAGEREVVYAPFYDILDDGYVTEILRSVVEVDKVREGLNLPPFDVEEPCGVKLIVAVPSVGRYWALKKKFDTRRLNVPAETARRIRFALRQITSAENYFSMRTTDPWLIFDKSLVGDSEGLDPLHPDIKPLLILRAMELRLFTAALALLASANLASVIRLPPKVSKVHHELKLAQTVDEGGFTGRSDALKLSAAATLIGRKIRNSVPERLFQRIYNTKGHIKLVSDIPLEMMPDPKGYPLGAVKVVSRIPSTSGDRLIMASIPKRTIIPSVKMFEHILVVRSYKTDDPIRPLAERAVKVVASDVLKVTFVDVESSAEFANAINEHKAAIVVYDGHGESGSKDSEFERSALRLSGERLELGELKGKLTHQPDILFLLACSTHPLDTYHLSTASDVFTWGQVRTVIGTLGLVSGEIAAVTLGRFAAWISGPLRDFLTGKRGAGAQSWAQAFSVFQRMCYVTDIIRALFDYSTRIKRTLGRSLTREEWGGLHVRGNEHAIRGGDWIELFLQDVASLLKLEFALVKAEWARLAYFSDALKYIQMGAPESILLMPDLPP